MAQTRNLSIPHRRVIAINGSGGAQKTISATIFSGYVEISECPPDGGTFDNTNFAPQGLDYQTPDDNFTDTLGLLPADVFSVGTKDGPNRSVGQSGWTTPDNATVPATVYMKVKSATATATQVEVREWPQR